jgi:pyruvate formate lyase activating enzyme
VRANEDGVLSLPFYGRASAIALDPIEKKPLYHFHPGQPILSVGFLGCSLRCPFCQNYSISQSTTSRTERVGPAELVKIAQDRGSFAIAYTYNEPTIHAEFVLEAGRLAHEAGLANVLVSAGYVNEAAAEDLLDVIDAANVDLKGFQPDFYRKELGAKLDPVKAFISAAARRIHLEVTSLIIPGKNDTDEEVEAMARFLGEIDPNIPYHLSAYYPTYKYTRAATPPQQIVHLKKLAQRHLAYVYPGNIRGEADTHCPNCGTLIVRRQGYATEVIGLADGHCTSCRHEIPIVVD